MSSNAEDILPLRGQQLKFIPHMGEPYFAPLPGDPPRPETVDTDSLGEANVITSLVKGSSGHKVVLDIDHPVKALSSSTKGHSHLFIDKEISWRDYKRIMKAFVKAGIVEPGFMRASVARGWTAVRVPWVKKVVDKN